MVLRDASRQRPGGRKVEQGMDVLHDQVDMAITSRTIREERATRSRTSCDRQEFRCIDLDRY